MACSVQKETEHEVVFKPGKDWKMDLTEIRSATVRRAPRVGEWELSFPSATFVRFERAHTGRELWLRTDRVVAVDGGPDGESYIWTIEDASPFEVKGTPREVLDRLRRAEADHR